MFLKDVQLRYIYTQLGYTKLSETHFEEAGNYFFRAEIDARALIRLFPDLCEGLLEYNNPEETIPTFKGLEETVRNVKAVEETGKLGISFDFLVVLSCVIFCSSPALSFITCLESILRAFQIQSHCSPNLFTHPSAGIALMTTRWPLTSSIEPSAQLLSASGRGGGASCDVKRYTHGELS
jgi:hypothetical protein